MKQVISHKAARPDRVGPFTIARALPNEAAQSVGPIMLLDHLPPMTIAAGELPDPDGSFAHPHRGIATFTYVLEGALTHADSSGGHGTITAGGVQWMKAGRGIVHDEMLPAKLRREGGRLHSFQFWINLPARHKAEPAEYMPVSTEKLPVVALPGGRAQLKVLLGEYDGSASPIPIYAHEFIWHLRVEPMGAARVALHPDLPVAGFLPGHGAVVSGTEVGAQRYFELGADGTEIEIVNPRAEPLDLLLFGGEPITEPVAMRGPFVMNTEGELKQAFREFRAGEYGQIAYQPETD
ncbi:pirin family protein [Limimaricola cinnabarinus]|uniref:Pirin-like protein YhhW, possibly qercetin 2,3-dioxygenase activity n=1 Tax=Limimaricola cinnabarinus LL-001 TaxID=1337093 RepID=U2Z8S8_9RHOB|nr:pirin family protein [Limimaricola cinnabarinus]GAD57462.1 pirin-like protein YhhW, possibly qercetin 2,3-dioxygenase activity [Limimaricola cinnabarinus LL-001]